MRWTTSIKLPSLALALNLLLMLPHAQAATFSLGSLGGWVGSGLTGFGVDGGGGVRIAGQTFRINEGNALVNSISFPVTAESSGRSFQAGVAAWSGSSATGPVLYLSDPVVMLGDGSWESFTFAPENLILNQSQQYLLFLIPTSGNEPFDSLVGLTSQASYPGGGSFFTVVPQSDMETMLTQSWNPVPLDMAFTITYQVPVPEPSSLAMLCLGSSALWLRRRFAQPGM